MLLVPMALATPRLTPPMYGDEPFHLVVLSSLAQDWDLELVNNLDLEHRPLNRIYITGKIFLHSPVLGVLLLPGFSVLGRSGALALLALAGAGVVALVAGAPRRSGFRRRASRCWLTALPLSYPLATFCSAGVGRGAGGASRPPGSRCWWRCRRGAASSPPSRCSPAR